MQTDPANFEYVIISGLKRKEQRWNPDENEQVAPEEKKKHRKLESDPMYKLEHGKQDVEKVGLVVIVMVVADVYGVSELTMAQKNFAVVSK